VATCWRPRSVYACILMILGGTHKRVLLSLSPSTRHPLASFTSS
jgi:hypothetical protein